MDDSDSKMPPIIKPNAATLFVIGNGPSLKKVDLHSLSQFDTLGMNAAYRFWRKINWRPTYYACLDLVVGLSHKDAIAELIRENRIKRFLLRSNLIDALGETASDARVINFDALTAVEKLLRYPNVTTGTHSSLWGAASGYKQIILLGIDGRYKNIIAGASRSRGIELEITQQPSENPNYFFDDYQQAGDRYNVPNPRPNLHIKAWRMTASILTSTQVSIFNANPDSAVRCIPFVNLEDLQSAGSLARAAEEKVTTMPNFELLHKSHNDSVSRIYRLNYFFRRNWLLCFTPLLILVAAYFGFQHWDVTKTSFFLPSAIIFLVTALWTALLFVRQTAIEHIKSLYDRIEALEEHARAQTSIITRNHKESSR